ncbi:MAG TPA: hypothetical protein VL371_09190 [Gemmataceae bacterium]|nr:hypothetical protein [Gemmataceae bacterium]
MTLYDFEDLVIDLEDGVVPSDLGERAAGPLYPLLTRRQLVRVVADQLYCHLDARPWHPECADAVRALLVRCDRLADGNGVG